MITSAKNIHKIPRLFFYALVNDLKHFDACIEIVTQINFGKKDLTTSNTEKSFFWPLGEPINGRAIDE